MRHAVFYYRLDRSQGVIAYILELAQRLSEYLARFQPSPRRGGLGVSHKESAGLINAQQIGTPTVY